MGTRGLSVNRLIRTQVVFSPRAAARRNFGVLCIAGPSETVTPQERIRSYTDLEAIAADFGIEAPEYQAAAVYFGQSPRPSLLMIARWVKTASPAVLRGGILTREEEDITAWTAITDGVFTIRVNGVEQTVSSLDFSGQTNLNGVASVVNEALTDARIVWDGGRFEVRTVQTGAQAALGWATPPTAGTDVSAMLKLTRDTALSPQPGMDAESPAECALFLADLSSDWYGLMFADPDIADEDHLAVAEAIEGMAVSHIYGVTVTDTRVLDAAYAADLASRFREQKRSRTVCQYSEHPYAIASFLGRAFTVNFSGNRTVINLMYKQEPGIVPEYLTETQAQTLKAKHCNVFTAYDNDTAIIQYGVTSGDPWFDEIHGTDWLQNAVQTEVYNLLYQSKTKIPQTDAGVHMIVTVIESVLAQAVTNGLVAPGTWNSDGFGALERGQYLAKGWYIHVPSVDEQAQSEREQRIAPVIQCAIKLAGAINEVDIIINVNR